jgi:putative Mg2+ transporter-C (MgtC) family protein
MKIEILNFFINMHNLEILMKLGVSLALGLVIGFEREITNKTAGLRTHILLCLGSTIFTILSIHGFTGGTVHNGVIIQNDPARIAAQILTGIGFIGGGAVLHYGTNVYGLTTAAALWITSSIGMAVGVGSYYMAILATLLTFIVLLVIRKIENTFLASLIVKEAKIKASLLCSKEQASEIQDWFYREFKNIEEIDSSKLSDKKGQVKLSFIVTIFDKNPISMVHKKLLELEDIESLTLKQIIH